MGEVTLAPEGRSERPVPRGAPGSGRRDRLATAVPFFPAAIVVAGWIAWAGDQGGYFPRTWYPSALAAVALLVVVAAGWRRVLPPSPWARAGLGGLAGLTAWSYLSIAWADAPGDAWEAANQLLLYLAVAWLLALVPWRSRPALVLLGAVAAGVTAICAISLIRAVGAAHLDPFFVEGRYSDPLGYSNAASAVAAVAFWPSLLLSYRRQTPAPLRPLFLASAVFLIEFSLMPQSRGSLFGLLVAGPVFLALAPDRLRLIAPSAVIAGAVAISIGPIYHVYTVGIEGHELISDQPLAPVLHDGARVIALTTAGALVAGMALLALDRFVRPHPEALRRIRMGAAVAAGLIALAGAGTGLANAGRISDSLSGRWEAFKSNPDKRQEPTGARLTASFADQRYDYWGVAADLFRESPVVGIGAGSYGYRYNAVRKYAKPSRYAHELWLRVLAEGGLVAALLLATYLVGAYGGLLAGWRRAGPEERAVAAGCSAVGIYFLVHASFDWIEQFPVLAAPALGLPLVGIAVVGGSRPAGAQRPRVVLAGRALAALAATLGLIALLIPYLSLRYLDRARKEGSRDAPGAFRDLHRAGKLNPLDSAPRLREGTLALSIEDYGRAHRALERSLDIQPTSYAYMELALLDARKGDFASAERRMARARELDRRDKILAEASATIANRDRVEPRDFNRKVLAVAREPFTRPVK